MMVLFFNLVRMLEFLPNLEIKYTRLDIGCTILNCIILFFCGMEG